MPPPGHSNRNTLSVFNVQSNVQRVNLNWLGSVADLSSRGQGQRTRKCFSRCTMATRYLIKFGTRAEQRPNLPAGGNNGRGRRRGRGNCGLGNNNGQQRRGSDAASIAPSNASSNHTQASGGAGAAADRPPSRNVSPGGGRPLPTSGPSVIQPFATGQRPTTAEHVGVHGEPMTSSAFACPHSILQCHLTSVACQFWTRVCLPHIHRGDLLLRPVLPSVSASCHR